MDQNYSFLKQTAAASFTLPDYQDIPDVGLFLDQVARYTLKFTDAVSIPPLTGSMISNYVKKKIIPGPVKKLYDREQIACLLFIAFAKSVVQIDDLGFLFEHQNARSTVEEAYGYFRKAMKASMDSLADNCSVENLPEAPFDPDGILKAICVASSHCIYVELCLREMHKLTEKNEA